MGIQDLIIEQTIDETEYERYLKTKKMPINLLNIGAKIWLNDDGYLHNTTGMAIASNGSTVSHDKQTYYYLNGVKYSKTEWERKTKRTIIFSCKNKDTLKKLLYIPELFQNVFYDNKKHFISLIAKI